MRSSQDKKHRIASQPAHGSLVAPCFHRAPRQALPCVRDVGDAVPKDGKKLYNGKEDAEANAFPHKRCYKCQGYCCQHDECRKPARFLLDTKEEKDIEKR